MRKLIFPALVALLVACGGDSATGPNASVEGNYTLQTVNGKSVPAVVFQDAQEKDEITAGNVNLNADHTWSASLSARVTDLSSGAAATISQPANGTYTTNNGSITLTDASDGSQLTGSIGGGTLTLTGEIDSGIALTLVFKR